MVERVGLAITGVAKDGDDLDSCHVPTAEFVHKLRLIAHLQGEEGEHQVESCLWTWDGLLSCLSMILLAPLLTLLNKE